jgi:hypothetical protein
MKVTSQLQGPGSASTDALIERLVAAAIARRLARTTTPSTQPPPTVTIVTRRS